MTEYPSVLIPVSLVLGLLLAASRPYAAFLAAVFVIVAGGGEYLNATRTEALGPYLNLLDAWTAVSLAAMVFDLERRRRKIRAPVYVPLLLMLLAFATVQDFARYGVSYESVRALRWAIQFPLAVLVGANLVTDAQRARRLLQALLGGAVAAALMHFAYIAVRFDARQLAAGSYQAIRTVIFLDGGLTPALLVTAVAWPVGRGPEGRPLGLAKLLGLLVAGTLFVASMALSLTRSVWIATVAALPAAAMVYRHRERRRPAGRRAALGPLLATMAVLAVVASVTVASLFPQISLGRVVVERVEGLFDPEINRVSVGTRRAAAEIELGDWLDGTLLLGRGLFFFQEHMREREEATLAQYGFGHLGYVTYLSQLGLVGLLLYGVYVPVAVVGDSRRTWRSAEAPASRYLALLAGCCILYHAIMFAMSSSLLMLWTFAPGILAGAAWRQGSAFAGQAVPDRDRQKSPVRSL